MSSSTLAKPPVTTPAARIRNRLTPETGLAVLAVGLVIIGVSISLAAFPESWNLGLAEPIDRARKWLIDNQTTHWLFLGLLNPITDLGDAGIRYLESVLRWFPWYVYPLVTGLGLWRVRGKTAGGLGAVGVLMIGITDLWDTGFDTLALMGVAVFCSLVIGVPLGIASWRSDRFSRVLRPALDAMQTMPGFVYLIPFVLLFGIGRVPALVATIIFALPPVVRLTDVGLRNVDHQMVEASVMFGATDRQTLRLVRLPAARPAILAGVNQTTMLAMSMVVIAAFIGAGGLGQDVLRAMRNINVGEASEAGLAIVIMAIILDRFSRGVASIGQSRRVVSPASSTSASDWEGRIIRGLLVIAALAALIGGWAGHNQIPEWMVWHYSPYVNSLTDWARDNLYEIGSSGIGTGPLSDFITLYMVTPLRELFSSGIPWLSMIGLGILAGVLTRGAVLGAGVGLALFGIGWLGMWELSMDTLAQTLVAVAATLALGIPLGIWASHSDRFKRLIDPILDFFQTIPSFVLLVPVITLFHVGRIPGIIASVIYALPAAVHYTDLGLRRVPTEIHEASTSFGSTRWQRLWRVELPLAAPELMVAVNQTIMLVLAMVVIAGLVGGGGLGLETVNALRRTDAVGRGFEAGIAIVLLAGILDRLTRGLADRLRPPPAT